MSERYKRPRKSNPIRANTRGRNYRGGNSSPYPHGFRWEQPLVEEPPRGFRACAPRTIPSEMHHVFEDGTSARTNPGMSVDVSPAREQAPPNEAPAAPPPIQTVTIVPQSQQEDPLSNVGRPRELLNPGAPQGFIQPSGIGGPRFEPYPTSNPVDGFQWTHTQHRQSRTLNSPRSTLLPPPATLMPSSRWPELPMSEGPNHRHTPDYPAGARIPASDNATNALTVDPRLLHSNTMSPSPQNSGDGRRPGHLSNVPEQYNEGGYPPQPKT